MSLGSRGRRGRWLLIVRWLFWFCFQSGLLNATAVPTPAQPAQQRLVQAPVSDTMNRDLPSASDAEEEEVASIKRIPAVTLQLWETLLKPRGFEINAGKLIRSPTKSQAGGNAAGDVEMSPLHAKTTNDSKGKGSERERDADANGSVLSSFRRVNSFAAPAVVASAPRQPFRRLASIVEPNPGPRASKSRSRSPGRTRNRSIPQENAAGPSNTTAAVTTGAGPSNLLFSGLKFKALGEARCAIVKSEIEGCGGRMISQEEEGWLNDIDFIIVRLVRCVWFLFPLLFRRY